MHDVNKHPAQYSPIVTKKGCINLRWTSATRRGRKRALLLEKACILYGLEPSPHLLDRLLADIDLIHENRLKMEKDKIELERKLRGE